MDVLWDSSWTEGESLCPFFVEKAGSVLEHVLVDTLTAEDVRTIWSNGTIYIENSV